MNRSGSFGHFGVAHAVRALRDWEDEHYKELYAIAINLDIVVLIFCFLDEGANQVPMKAFVMSLPWAERTIYAHLRSLEKGGWLRRTKGNLDDRRFTDVVPTEKLLTAFDGWQEQILINFERAYKIKVDPSVVTHHGSVPAGDKGLLSEVGAVTQQQRTGDIARSR